MMTRIVWGAVLAASGYFMVRSQLTPVIAHEITDLLLALWLLGAGALLRGRKR